MGNIRNLSFFDIYEKNALHNASLPALIQDNHTTTHAALFSKTTQLANGLNRLNLQSGARIAILSKNHPVFFHLFGAAAALNLTLVLINRRLSQEEISHIIEDTTPSVLFADEEMADLAQTLGSAFQHLKHLFIVDDGNSKMSDLYIEGDLETAVDDNLDDPFIIIHTAAMQGKSRGAVLSQNNVILSNQQVIETFSLDHAKGYLNILPLFHIMGVNMGLGMLQAGGRNIIMDKFDPDHALSLIQEHKATILGSFPPILNNLIEAQKNKARDLSSLETAAGLDGPDTVEEWESLTNATFWTMYGQTETSGLITFAPYFEKTGSAGRISALAHIKITDDFDQFLPAGETGEIVLKGPLVFQGYWGADDLNAHTMRGGWHHTGDLGMMDKEGFLFFKGRKAEKELIKPGGENVFPAEVEKAVIQHEAVKEVCVFGVPDKKFGEGIKAVCALHPGIEITAEELIKFTGTLIAGYKKPRIVEFVDELPKTADNVIDREKTKEMYP